VNQAMIDELQGEVRIQDESHIISVRKSVREVATRLGFGITDVTRIITAASELARNIYHYAGTGVMRWRILDKGVNIGIELIFEDHGPGIADVDQVMQQGYSTSGGLGMGLPGSKRLMDEFEIQSKIGLGTIVTVKKWKKK
jgi:Anti-sigma regulatory factor (Ser/Thr protein kinase)